MTSLANNRECSGKASGTHHNVAIRIAEIATVLSVELDG